MGTGTRSIENAEGKRVLLPLLFSAISIYGIISFFLFLSSLSLADGGITGSMIRNEKQCVISGYTARCAGDREQKGPRVTSKTYRTTEIVSLTARSIRPFSAALAREDAAPRALMTE